MTILTDFINNTLYPSLFGSVDRAFPSMEFQKYNGGWRSKYKLDGELSHDRRQDKSVITPRVPHRVIEQGGDSKDLLSLYMEQNSLSTIEAVKSLCNLLGLQVPETGDSEAYSAYKEKQELLEKLATQAKKNLREQEGKAVLNYLRQVRGYSDEFIEFAAFGVVTDPMRADLIKAFSYINREGQEVCALPYDVIKNYPLTIPYRTGGKIAGFVFRAVEANTKPKYKDAFVSASATKKYHLFGLTGINLTGDSERDKDIIVVEGEIDALRAQFASLPNVVAASGGHLSEEALQEAKRKGVRRVTILFDTEETTEKQSQTNKKIEKAIDTILKAELYPLVAELPSADGEKVDTDSYLKNHTGEQLSQIVEQAKAGSLYLFNQLLQAAIDRQGGEGEQTTYKNLHEFKSETIALCNRPNITPTDRDAIFAEFANSTGDYITKDSLQEEADRLKAIADSDRQKRETLSTISEAYKLAEGQGVEAAYTLLQERLPQLRQISKAGEYSKLLLLPTAEAIKTGFKQRPTGVPTSFVFGDGDKREQLLLPCGALTYICAPTSHGKSRMLQNLALQLAQDETPGAVLYFSFEEDAEAVKMQLLNTYIAESLSRNNLRSINSYYRKGEDFFTGQNLNKFLEKEAGFMSLLTQGKLRVFYEDYDSSDLIEAIRYLHKQIPVKAVFVDYIQLLHKRGSRLQRKDELKEICKDFMAMAVDTGLPVVLAAQLNREAYSPVEMAVQNIAEASDIEHSANIVMLLWNSSVKPLPKSTGYFQDKGKEEKLTKDAQRIADKGFTIGQGGKLYAVLAKNRGGARNIDAVLDFNGNTGAITQPTKKPAQGSNDFAGLYDDEEDL